MTEGERPSDDGGALHNGGCAAVAGCAWLISGLLLLPGLNRRLIRPPSVGLALLIPYPAEQDEVVPWLIRIVPFAILVATNIFLL